jgi:hypothetical protein
MRMDVYPNRNSLSVLEVNTAFVDGWGTALNFSRAIGASLEVGGLFPNRFGLMEEQYRPELKVLLGELALHGQTETSLVDWQESGESQETPIYVYGRRKLEADQVLPKNGLFLDNKLWLTAFSKLWQGTVVEIPRSFSCAGGTEWQEVPKDVYLKFADKSSEESERARFSVRKGKPQGKAPFLKRAYSNGQLIAQSQVPVWPEEIDGALRNAQLVVLSKGDLICGYVQYGYGSIINDNSIHGPLKFEG